MKKRARSYIQHSLNVASPVASALSLLNPLFLTIPVITSVANELFSYFDSKSIESRLEQLQIEVEKEGIQITDFAEKISQLDEHGQYIVRNSIKHLCLSAQPEVTDAINKAIIDLIMNKPYGLPEHACEILQQCNADDISLLRYIKLFQKNGDKSIYNKKLMEVKAKKYSGGMHDRSLFHGESNTVFWKDFIKMFALSDTINDMSVFLNVKFAIKNKDGAVEEKDIIDFAYIAKSIIKMQNLGVMQCDFISTLGTISTNHIDRFHITFFGEKLLEYIDIDSENNI